MSNLPIWIDSHHHLWHLSHVQYPWLNARGEKRFFGQPDPIRKNYLVDDFIADHQLNISQSVHIQVGAAPGEELKETAWLDQCHLENKHYPAKAIVALDMLATNLEQQIDQHQQYNITQGVRHIIGKNPEENKNMPDFCQKQWLVSFKTLVKSQLSFDLQLTEEQYEDVFNTLSKVPELNVAICHLASPWDQSKQGFLRWKLAMKKFAQLPNCTIKISGFSMFNHGMVEDKFTDYAHTAIDIFSPKRCMFGSNFPVDKLYITYQELMRIWQSIANRYSGDDQDNICANSARKFYDLPKL